VVAASFQPNAPLVPGQDYSAIVDPAEQGSLAVRHRWRSVSNSAAYGGSYLVEHLTGAKVAFAFDGGSVTWFTVAGPTQGRVSVSIDGHRMGTFDQSALSTRFGVERSSGGLGAGPHTITVIALGERGRVSTGARVAVDAFRRLVHALGAEPGKGQHLPRRPLGGDVDD
jgi:hypothetical protein